MVRLYIFTALIQFIQSAVSPYLQIMLRNSGYSYTMTGTIMGAGLLLSVIGPLLISYISQKSAKPRLVLVISVFSIMVFFYPVVFPVSTAVTVICYSLGFMSLASLNPLQDSYINTTIKDPSGYGRIRSCGTAGYVLSLILSAVIAFPDQASNSSIFINISLKVMAFVLFGLLFLPKDRIPEKEEEKREKVSFRSLGGVFYLYIFIFGLTRLAHGATEKLLSSYMTEYLNLGNYFTFFVAVGAAFEAAVLFFFGKKTAQGPGICIRYSVIAAAALSVRLLIYYLFPTSILMFTAAQAMHGLTFGMAHLAATSYIFHLLKEEKFSLGMGVYQALGFNLPEMIAVSLGGAVIDKMGYPAMFGSYSVLPLLAAALLILFRKKLVRA